MKKILFKRRSDGAHWVGDGFPVRTIFTYNDDPQAMSPFLLMDYGGPVEFPASDEEHLRGVGEHPHRGFETVTIVYAGEVEHRDSAGGGGKIGPGDVQWMTAASGLVHEEKHGRDFAKRGGIFEMVQLWVNLPAKDKMLKPRYQGIIDAQVPKFELADGAGRLRVIAGNFRGAIGPARTFTPMDIWDLRLTPGKSAELQMPVGHTTLIFVLQGRVRLAGGEIINSAELAVLDRVQSNFTLEAVASEASGPPVDAKILILGGEPIAEPVMGHGPFVMNTKAELQQAFVDFEAGRMGRF